MSNWQGAVARVWHRRPDGTEEYRGSAFLVGPRHLLTAWHVIVDIPMTEIYLTGADSFEDGKMGVADIKALNEADVALVQLKQPVGREALVPVSAQLIDEDLRGRQLAFCGFGTAAGSREVYDRPVSGIEGGTGLLVADGFVAKGMSGGPVVLEGCLAGIIRARHTDQNKSYVIPLCAYWEPFSAFFGTIEESARIETRRNVSPSSSGQAAKKKSTPFDQVLQERIAEELALGDTRAPLLQALAAELKEPAANPQTVAAALVAMPDLEALFSLAHRAAAHCLRRLQGAKDDRLGPCRESAKAVFGWLVLRAVDDDWITRHGHLIDSQIQFKIEDEAVIEVVLSRADEKPAGFGGIRGSRVLAEGGLNLNDCFEMGYAAPVQFQQIACAVWPLVFDGEKRQQLSDKQIETLNVRLAKRGEWKKRGYLTIHLGNHNDPKANPALYTELRARLPSLRLIFIALDGHGDMLVMGEIELGQEIYAFVETLKEYA